MNQNITMNMIRAAIPCAATKDVRYYLQGALFTYTAADKRLRVVSTDGSVMSCFAAYYPEGTEPEDFALIVPLETLKAASKARTPSVMLKDEGGGTYSLGGALFKPVDAKYPDYRRVIPTIGSLSGEPGNYQAELLTRAQNAMRAYRNSTTCALWLAQNGRRGAAVLHDGHDDALVVVMPWLTGIEHDNAPAYAAFA